MIPTATTLPIAMAPKHNKAGIKIFLSKNKDSEVIVIGDVDTLLTIKDHKRVKIVSLKSEVSKVDNRYTKINDLSLRLAISILTSPEDIVGLVTYSKKNDVAKAADNFLHKDESSPLFVATFANFKTHRVTCIGDLGYKDNPTTKDYLNYFVDELVLGSSLERTKNLFTAGTKVLSCFERNDVVYIDLSADIINMGDNVLDELEKSGTSVTHYDMRFLKPLDTTIIKEVARKFKRIITIEDGCKNGGFGSAVLESLCETCCEENLPMPRVNILGIPDTFVNHGTVPQLQDICGIDVKSIKAIF